MRKYLLSGQFSLVAQFLRKTIMAQANIWPSATSGRNSHFVRVSFRPSLTPCFGGVLMKYLQTRRFPIYMALLKY
jgi:hypothetical protein